MKEKEKLEKDLNKLKAKFEKAKQQDEKKGTARVRTSTWLPHQLEAVEKELTGSNPDFAKIANGIVTIEGALKKLGVS